MNAVEKTCYVVGFGLAVAKKLVETRIETRLALLAITCAKDLITKA